jgi:predicted lipid-binding transport protein (Tim44 family)
MLRNILSILLITLVTLGLFINDAEARRFGGGRSFGMSRSASSFSRPASTGQGFSRSQGFGQTASPMSRWMGPLAGLAAGGLLASLFMSHGIGSGIMSWLLVGGLLFVAITLIRNKMRPQPYSNSRQENNFRNNFANDNASAFMRNNAQQAYSSSSAAPVNNYPIGFDPQLFLRDAKVSFMRLQTAYDQKNLNDIREFTTPEVTAEIQMQLQERGIAENVTNVISLEAELLDVENGSQMISGVDMQTSVASVRFSGQVQEDKNAAAVSINEIWHFRKEVGSLRWIVAGVQQH